MREWHASKERCGMFDWRARWLRNRLSVSISYKYEKSYKRDVSSELQGRQWKPIRARRIREQPIRRGGKKFVRANAKNSYTAPIFKKFDQM